MWWEAWQVKHSERSDVSYLFQPREMTQDTEVDGVQAYHC